MHLSTQNLKYKELYALLYAVSRKMFSDTYNFYSVPLNICQIITFFLLFQEVGLLRRHTNKLKLFCCLLLMKQNKKKSSGWNIRR